MNLVLLDVDGTLTQSYEYDRVIFGAAIGEVLAMPPVDADLNGYVDKTSLGVTQEAIKRLTGRDAGSEEVVLVKENVLRRLEEMYRESAQVFREVSGALHFLERLRNLNDVGIAIATGCWRSEAMFKLRASGLSADEIPMATSDDDRNRLRIMEIAVHRAEEIYHCGTFERIIYIGDGPWDLQTSRSLGYKFIGIGPRVQVLRDIEFFPWHQDFMDIEAVFASLSKVLNS